jgi:molybdopterin converting factor small subunit
MPAANPATLGIRVLLFASYAEALGFDQVELSLEQPSTVEDAITRLRALPGGEKLPIRPLCALNLVQAVPGDSLSPGDELALLPPLSGG